MYSSKILELKEANKVSMSTDCSVKQSGVINGIGNNAREDSRHLDENRSLQYDKDNSENVGGPNDQIYINKLSNLKAQLQNLHDGNHKEYNRKKRDILLKYTERIKINDAWRESQKIMIEQNYEKETNLAYEDFEEKKAELKENLIMELEDKKRLIEQERYSLDLNGDSMEYKPVSTRKLRRRGNEPQPVVEKRRKTIVNSLDSILDDQEIEDDINKIFKNKILNVKRSKPSSEYSADNNSTRKQRLSGPSTPGFIHHSPASSPGYNESKNDGHVLTRSGMSRTIR